MSDSGKLTLQTRSDDYSLQVAAIEDERFWFRLEREEDRDRITDFFLGSAPRSNAGRLLAECYQVLKIAPKPVLIFSNILPSSDSAESVDALIEARDFYTECGEHLLRGLGASTIVGRLVKDRGKYDLVLERIRNDPSDAGQE